MISVDHAEERQGQDIDLRMAPEPENMLPQHWHAAPATEKIWVPKCRVAVEHDEPGRQHRKGQQNQIAVTNRFPGEDWHAKHRHAGRSKIKDRPRTR